MSQLRRSLQDDRNAPADTEVRAKAEKLHVHVLPAEEDEWMDKKMRLP